MSDVLDAVRSKYPQYKDVPDDQLTEAIGTKYPQYLQKSPQFKRDFDRLAIAKIQPSVAEQHQVESIQRYGTPDAEQVGNADFLKAVGENPKQFIEALPAIAMGAAAIPGKLAYYQAADAVSKLFNEPEYGGNLQALEQGKEELPVEKFVSAAAKTNPKLAVAADLGQSATELAPTLALANAPAALNRLLAAGFSASMIASAPRLASELGQELGKPEEEQDAGKIAQLRSQAIQTFLFAPLAAAGAAHSTPLGETAGKALADEVRAADLGDVDAAARRGATPSVQPGGRPSAESPKPTVQSPTAERIVAATYTDPETGTISTGADHIEAAAKQGVTAPAERTARETPAYGFITDQGRVVTRPEAQQIATEAGQVTRQPAKGEQFHSDMLKMPTEEQHANTKPSAMALAVDEPAGSGQKMAKGKSTEVQQAAQAQKEMRAVRTQIRATEQAADPDLQEAAKVLDEGSAPAGGRVEGMGGGGPRPAAAQGKAGLQAPSGAPAGTAPAAGGAVQRLSAAASLLKSPDPKSPGRAMQLIIRAYLGKEYGQVRQMDAAFREVKRYFDKTPKPRDYVYQPGDELAGKMPKGWQVQWAIDTGNTSSLTPAEQSFAKAYRSAMDWAIGAVQEVSPDSLKDLYENYFGRIWKDPEKNGNAIRQWINSRPLEGNKSFLKQRVLSDWIDGIKMGLEPLSDNPVDMMMYKLGEMVQFAGARMMKQEAKVLGLRKFFYLGEKIPEGWRVDPDPKGEVFGPPTVTLKEAFDEQLRVKTLEMLDALGIKHERLAKIGGRRWGYAQEGVGAAAPGQAKPGEKLVTKFGGPDLVFWHEFGHIMDFRYPDLRQMLGFTKGGRDVANNELRALADLRGARKQYAHKAEEKMANVFHAYVHAPELFQKTAPTVFAGFEKWLNAHPEVKGPMNEIRPSLKLGAGTTEMQLAGPVLLGHWAMPEAAVRVMENFQRKSLLSKRNVISGLRALNGLLTSSRLFGFFHGGMVTDDSFYGGLSLILNDALRGKLTASEAAKNLLMVPRAFRLGGKIRSAIEDPAQATAVNRELGKLALEANLRSHIGTYDMSMGRRWARAFNELQTAPSIGAAWETFWRAPFAAMALTMKPVMDGLVPRMKYGMNGLQTIRILQDMPGVPELTADELFERTLRSTNPQQRAAFRQQIQQALESRLEFRDQLAKSADSVEDRIGQVTYDNLFLNKTLKDASTLGLTAFGWHLTKYRGVLGGAADWARAAAAVARGQKPEVTFRMTYLPAMVMGHAIIGGVLHYALTGKRPRSLQDYLFPESGLLDAYGNPIRLAIADYMKDIAGDVNAFRFHGLRGEVDRQVARLAPSWNMAAEMYRNKDFWGNQIFESKLPDEPEMEHLLKVLGQGVEYLSGSSTPFTLRTGGKLQDAGGNRFLSYAAPFVGVVPAPRDATMTPSQALAEEIMAEHQPTGGRTPDQAKRAQAIGQIVRDVRTGKINDAGDFEARERAAGVKTKQQETAIQQRVLWTPFQRQVWLMSLDDAMRVWDLANDQERLQLVKFRPDSKEGLAEKVAKAAASGRLDAATAQRYVALLLPYWQRALRAQAQGGQPKQRQAFRSMLP